MKSADFIVTSPKGVTSPMTFHAQQKTYVIGIIIYSVAEVCKMFDNEFQSVSFSFIILNAK